MTTDNLEDLLYSKIFYISDVIEIQDVIDKIEQELRSDGKNYVITKIFSNNITRTGKTVVVHADSRFGNILKVITVEPKPLESVFELEIDYYDPIEVEVFCTLLDNEK